MDQPPHQPGHQPAPQPVDRRSVPVALGAPIALLTADVIASMLVALPSLLYRGLSVAEGVAVVVGSFLLQPRTGAGRRLLVPLRVAALLYLVPVGLQLAAPVSDALVWEPTLGEALVAPLWAVWLPVAALLAAREAGANELLRRSWRASSRWALAALGVAAAGTPVAVQAVLAGDSTSAVLLLLASLPFTLTSLVHATISAARDHRLAEQPTAPVVLRPFMTTLVAVLCGTFVVGLVVELVGAAPG